MFLKDSDMAANYDKYNCGFEIDWINPVTPFFVIWVYQFYQDFIFSGLLKLSMYRKTFQTDIMGPFGKE